MCQKIVPENCFIVVHVLVDQKESQILNQRDGKIEVFSDLLIIEYENALYFRTRQGIIVLWTQAFATLGPRPS